MTVLVDSSVVLGFLLKRDRAHGEAKAVMQDVLGGGRGLAAVTDYIVDEVLTFLVARRATRAQLDHAIAFLLGDGKEPGAFVLHRVGPDHFAEAIRLLRRHRERGLSFTDCTSLAVMASAGIPAIVSFDRGFDGLVERIS